MKQHILIFDMDGTLLDSRVDITRAINRVRHDFGLDPLSVETVVSAINSDQKNLAYIFYNTSSYEAPHRERFERYYHELCTQSVSLYKDIKILLQTLKEQGALMSVATNAPAPFALRMLKHLDAEHYFDYILGADCHKPKPNPEMINKILSNYSYDDKKHFLPIIVGDNQKDIEAGKKAGIRTLHVAWGFDKELRKNSITKPLELLKHLDTI